MLIYDLLRRTARDEKAASDQYQLFADFNGLPNDNARTEFYQHDANWTNRMILGLRGKVQCIYIDPPYGIKFNSNFQWSTRSRDVKDGNVNHITREPEQVKAFRDTWRDGIHSYLTDSASIFVQIGDENDLALDPTCGSGTTAYVAEHWGRRWITIDTSRVAHAIRITCSPTLLKANAKRPKSHDGSPRRFRPTAISAKALSMSECHM